MTVERARWSSIAWIVAVAGCGARTELAPPQTFADDASVADSGEDAPEDVVVETSVACVSDRDCDDAIDCTRDRCDTVSFTCVHALDDTWCDDGSYCDGRERCSASTGCVNAPPIDCSDGIDCTADACDESTRSCRSVPDDSRCAVSYACDPALGCQARAFAHSSGTLYSVRLPSGDVQEIGPLSTEITDIALHPTGILYGVSFTDLYTVDPVSAAVTRVSNASLGSANALDAAPDGTLYVAGDSTVSVVDPLTGAATPFATLPSGAASSGDLAFLQGRLLVTTHGLAATGDDLVEVDTSTRTARVIGSIGYDCVYGLAAFGATLYGMTCEGRVLGIDARTGRGSELSRTSVMFWGASAR